MRRHAKILGGLRLEPRIVISAALLLGLGLPVYMFMQDGSYQPATVVVPYTKITEGMQATVARRVNYVLKSPEELASLWTAIGATGEPPTIDFNTHAVIAVFAGNQPAAEIRVEKIEDSDKRLVSIKLAKLNGGCEIRDEGPSPYEIVAVAATSLPLAHEDIETPIRCE